MVIFAHSSLHEHSKFVRFWGHLLHSPLQVSLQIFNPIQVWALAQPYQTFFLVKQFLCRCHVKDKVYLRIFRRNLKSQCREVLFPSPVWAEEKQLHSMMLPTPCFTVDMVFLWWSAVMFVSLLSHKNKEHSKIIYLRCYILIFKIMLSLLVQTLN